MNSDRGIIPTHTCTEIDESEIPKNKNFERWKNLPETYSEDRSRLRWVCPENISGEKSQIEAETTHFTRVRVSGSFYIQSHRLSLSLMNKKYLTGVRTKASDRRNTGPYSKKREVQVTSQFGMEWSEVSCRVSCQDVRVRPLGKRVWAVSRGYFHGQFEIRSGRPSCENHRLSRRFSDTCPFILLSRCSWMSVTFECD